MYSPRVYFHAKQTHFLTKGFARDLDLKQRHTVSVPQKWPTASCTPSSRSIFHLIGSCDKYYNPAETRRIFSCQEENHSTMTAFIIFGHSADTTCMFI